MQEVSFGNNLNDPRNEPISVGEWVWTWILLAIPPINIIALFVWAFGSETKFSKKNYSRAILIILLILLVITGALVGIFIYKGVPDNIPNIDKILETFGITF
jgi:succinate dehydrogenase/fumarate reductase cytochrome b subunit